MRIWGGHTCVQTESFLVEHIRLARSHSPIIICGQSIIDVEAAKYLGCVKYVTSSCGRDSEAMLLLRKYYNDYVI